MKKGLCTCKSSNNDRLSPVDTVDGICTNCGYYAVMGQSYAHSSEKYNGELKRKFQTDEYSLPNHVKEFLNDI